jgi:hypothetical protein
MRAILEPGFGGAFDLPEIHQGSESPAINAAAFTQSAGMNFGAGAYGPSANSGQSLLAHELSHVVQQRAAAPFMHQY